MEKDGIYKVYILNKTVKDIFFQCQKAVPNETLGKLIGYRCEWNGINYVKIVDCVTGDIECSHIHAKFTLQGIRECELFLDERYLGNENRPYEVGLFHSHPFGVEPFFSSIDEDTFLNFPYLKKDNVFILIDPLISYFKVYVIDENEEKNYYLKQVKWIYYYPSLEGEING